MLWRGVSEVLQRFLERVTLLTGERPSPGTGGHAIENIQKALDPAMAIRKQTQRTAEIGFCFPANLYRHLTLLYGYNMRPIANPASPNIEHSPASHTRAVP
jgi:hypothetical protein